MSAHPLANNTLKDAENVTMPCVGQVIINCKHAGFCKEVLWPVGVVYRTNLALQFIKIIFIEELSAKRFENTVNVTRSHPWSDGSVHRAHFIMSISCGSKYDAYLRN